mgnify:CR=1 FL=1
MNNKITVITVTLNCRDLAIETAKSVLSQTSQEYEYVIKDGGSTDGTVESLRSMGLEVFVMADTGIYDAMNQAIGLASGDYLYFLNAGDTFFDDRVLEKVIIDINDDASIYYCDICLLPMNIITNYPPVITKYYLFRKNINHQACFISRRLYIALGKFKVEYKFNADQYILRDAIINHNEISKKLNVVVSRWSYGGVSTRKSNRKIQSKERWRMIKDFYSWNERLIYGMRSFYFMNFAKAFIWDLKYNKILNK